MWIEVDTHASKQGLSDSKGSHFQPRVLVWFYGSLTVLSMEQPSPSLISARLPCSVCAIETFVSNINEAKLSIYHQNWEIKCPISLAGQLKSIPCGGCQSQAKLNAAYCPDQRKLAYVSIHIVCVYIVQLTAASGSLCTSAHVGMKTVRIFSDRIRDRIRLEGF
jgi:hypothetical protein